MLFMIVEHYKDGDPGPVYERFRARGRLAPDGLRYVSSWVDEPMERCFQVMEAPIAGSSMRGSPSGAISSTSR